jgi:hypothetical protein
MFGCSKMVRNHFSKRVLTHGSVAGLVQFWVENLVGLVLVGLKMILMVVVGVGLTEISVRYGSVSYPFSGLTTRGLT